MGVFPGVGEDVLVRAPLPDARPRPTTESSDRATVARLLLSEDFAEMLERVRNFSDEFELPEVDYRIHRTTDGEIRHLRTLGRSERDANGRIVRITGASRDVTEQEALEDTVRRGRANLDALVDSNVAGVFFSNLGGRLTRANDAVLTALGYSQSDLPLDWKTVSPNEPLPREALAPQTQGRTGTPVPFEKVFVSRSGEPVPMLLGCAQLDPDQTIYVAIDLSDRKRAEALIAQHQQELEETVAERTRELLESRDRLMHAERMAAVGTLAAGVARQINNPIGAILNTAEFAMLCAEDEDEDARSIFRKALESNLAEARRCALIVKNMLQFSRDEPTEKWLHDLNQVVQHAHRAISAYAHDRGAQITIVTPREAVFALISPIEIEQAIVNILRNAIESRDDGVNITLSLLRRDKTAEIEVLDDGRGIDPTDQAHVFEPFFSTRTRDGGTGLGLSVAHGVIRDHGGEIRIESVPGEGTRLLLVLPPVDQA